MTMNMRNNTISAIFILTSLILCAAPGCTSLDSEPASGFDAPTLNYTISGTVVDAKDTRRAIPKLEVVIARTLPRPCTDTLYTGDDGRFAWENAVSTFGQSLDITILVTDRDGNENASYLPYFTHLLFNADADARTEPLLPAEVHKTLLIKMQETPAPIAD
jgi:putative lipoprotein (rSAM/lipoprotein system)